MNFYLSKLIDQQIWFEMIELTDSLTDIHFLRAKHSFYIEQKFT